MKCKICLTDINLKKSGKHGYNHFIWIHKISNKQYYDQYLKNEFEGFCKCCNKLTTFISIISGYHIYCSTKCMTNDQKIKEKKIQTCIERYNTENPLQNKDIQEKVKNTNIKRYGGNAPYCSTKVQNNGKETCMILFGVDNYSKTPQFKRLARENLIEDIKNGLKDKSTFTPRKGKQESQILDEFEKLTNCLLPIRGEKLIGFFPDSRNEEKKIIVEIYEPWHKYSYWIKKDLEKKKVLENEGYKFFIIWQDEWISNKQKIVDEFKKLTE